MSSRRLTFSPCLKRGSYSKLSIPKVYTENELISYTKVFVPGAGSDRLLAQAAELYQKFTFSLTILHVGANYVRTPSHPHDASTEITSLLAEIASLFGCLVSFSCILPQMINPYVNDYINSINNAVECR